MPLYSNASRTPAVLAANRFDAVTCFPTTTLAASSSATGHAIDSVADMRRDTTWWQGLNDGASNPTAYLHTLDADLGAGRAAGLSAVFLDRGHNLWGRAVSVRSGDGTTFTTIRTAVVPTLTVDSTVPAGGDPYTGWCCTEEGALWTILSEPADAVSCRVVRVAIVGAAGYVPAVTGIVAGAHVQLAQYLDTFDDDARGRTQTSATSTVGWKAADTTYTWRTGRLAMSAIGAREYDDVLRELSALMFIRNQASVVCFEPGRYPERAGLFTYDGPTLTAELTRVYRKTGWPLLEHLAALTPPVIAHGLTGLTADAVTVSPTTLVLDAPPTADAVTVTPTSLSLTLGSTGGTSFVSALSADSQTVATAVFTAGAQYEPHPTTLSRSVRASTTYVGSKRLGRVAARTSGNAIVRGHPATITVADPSIATATIAHGLYDSYDVEITGVGVGTTTVSVTVDGVTANVMPLYVAAAGYYAKPQVLLDCQFPPVPAAPTGRTFNPTSAAQLQTMLNSWQHGDQYIIPTGADWSTSTSIDIPVATAGGSGFCYILPSDYATLGAGGDPDAPLTLTQQGTRPKLRVNNSAGTAMRANNGVKGLVIRGLELCETAKSDSQERYAFANWGRGDLLTTATTTADLCAELHIHQMVYRQRTDTDCRRGTYLCGAGVVHANAVYIDLHHTTTDSQAVNVSVGHGPYAMIGDVIKGRPTSESIAFGGAYCPNYFLMPKDIECSWPMIDKGPDPDLDIDKNFVEWKHGGRIVIKGVDARGTVGGDGGQPGIFATGKSTVYGSTAVGADATIHSHDITIMYARVHGVGILEWMGNQTATGNFDDGNPNIAGTQWSRNLELMHIVLTVPQADATGVFRFLSSPSAVHARGLKLHNCTVLLSHVSDQGIGTLAGAPTDVFEDVSIYDNVFGFADYAPAAPGAQGDAAIAAVMVGGVMDWRGNLMIGMNARVQPSMTTYGATDTYFATVTAAGFAADPRGNDDLNAWRITGHAGKGADIDAVLAFTAQARAAV